LALVITKTHYCDDETKVCLRTFSLVSDPANVFIQDNFQVFDTRFSSHSEKLDVGEELVRKEWEKFDSGPEFIIVDPVGCKNVFRARAESVADSGIWWLDGDKKKWKWTPAPGDTLDFKKNYLGFRSLVLENPIVSHLLGDKYINGDQEQISAELERASEIRAKIGPMLTIDQFDALAIQRDKKLGFKTN
jgi:hypothetical protein